MDIVYNVIEDYFYDANFMRKRALARTSRESIEYNKASSYIFDTTSSCDKDEAINWLKFYMSQAMTYRGEPIYDVIHKGMVIINNKVEASAFWLASYDFYSSLVKQG